MKAKSFLLYITWLCHCAWMADTMSSATFSTTTVHLSDTDSVIVNSDVPSSSSHSPISELISSYSILGTNPVDVQTSFSSASDHFSADMSTHAVETTATNTPSLASVTLILANVVTSSSNSSYIFDTDIVSSNSNIDTGIVTSSRNSDFIVNSDSVTSSSDFIFNTGTMTSHSHSDFTFNTASSNSDFVQNIVTASSNSDFIQNIDTASSKSDFIFNTVTSSKNSDFILDTVTSSQNSDFVPNSVTSSENSDLVPNSVTSSEKSDFVLSTVTPSESSDFILDTNTISRSSRSIFTTITSNEASATNFNIFTTKSEVTNFYQNSDFKSEDILESSDILKTEITSSPDMESLVEKKTEFASTTFSISNSPITSEVVTTASDSVSSSVSVLNILPTATSDAVSVSDTRSYLDTNSQDNQLYSSLTDDLSGSLQDTLVYSLYGQSSFVPSFLSVASSLHTESISSTTISPSFYDVSTESGLISSSATTAMSSQFSTTNTQSVESALKSESITYSDYNQTVIQTDSLTTVLSSDMLSSPEMEITESMKTPTIPSQSTYQMTTGIVDSLVSSMSYQPSIPISTSTSTYFSTYESSNQASAQSSIMHSLEVASTGEIYSASEVLNTTRSQLSQSTENVISSSQSDGGYTSYLISSDITQMQQESDTTTNSSPIEETLSSVIYTSSTAPEEYTSYRINNSLLTDVAFPYVSSTISRIDSSSEVIEMYGNYSVSSMNFYASTPRSSTLYQQGQQTNQQSSTSPTQQISFLFTDLVSSSLSSVMSTENITPSTSIEETMLQSSPSVQVETSSVSYTGTAGLSSMSSEVVLTQNSNQESNILTSSTESSIFVSGSEHISKVTAPISYSTKLPLSTAIYQATTEMIELTDTSLSSIFTNQKAISTSSTYSFSRDFTSYPIATYPSRSTSYIGMESSYSDVISGSMTETVPLYFTMAPSATITNFSSPTEISSVYQNESATYSNLYSLPHTITFPIQSENNTISITTTTIQSGAPIFTSDILESYSESSSAVNQILLTSSSDSLQSATDLESSSESLLSFYYDLLTTTMFSDLLTSSSKLSSPELILDTRSDSNSVSTSSSMSVIPTVESSTHLIQLFPSTQHLPSQTSSFYPTSLFSVTDQSETSTLYILSHLNESVYQTVPSSTLELVLPTPSVSPPKQSSGTSILPGFLDSTIEGIESPVVSKSVSFSTSLSRVASAITTADGHKASVNSLDGSNILMMTSESVLEQSLSKSSLLTVPKYILGSESLLISSSTPTYRDSDISVLESSTMTQTVELSLYLTTDLSTVKASSSSIYVESSASSLSIVEVSTEPVTGSSTGSTSIVSTPGEIFESTIKASVVPSTLEVESVSDSVIVTQSSVVVSTVESVTFVAPSVEISVESTTASSVVSPTSVLVSGSTDESTSDSVHLASLSVVVSSSDSSMLALSSVEPSTTGMVSSPELHTTGQSNLPTISIVSSPLLPVDSTLSYTSTPLPLEITSVSLTPTNTVVPSFSVVSSVVDLVSPTLESSPETAMETNKETSSSLTDVVSILPSDTPLLTTSVLQPSPEFVSSSSLTTITGSPLEQSSIDLTSDFIQSSSISPVESTVAMNSSTLEPPTSTDGLNTSSALEDFWIKTVLKIRKSVDIESPEFKDNLEVKLVEAYSEAYKRQEEIDNGVYEPLLRRKRMASSSDINLQILNITRVENTNNVDVVYILQQNGVYVPAATATDKLNLFSDQELALRLGYVVDKNAVAYNEPIVGPTSTEDKKLWIIGAVLGPIAALLFIWFILCCVYRCCKRPAQEENKHKASEPHLVMVKRADRNGERQHLDIQVIHNHHEPDYVEEPVEKGTGPSILQSTKRGLYEVNQHQDEEEAPLQQKLPSPKQKTPVKKGNLTKEDIQMVSEGDTVTYISEGDLTASRPPKPKTRKSKTKKIEENLYGEDSMTEQELMDDRPYHTHPPSHDLNDKEIMQKAALERKRNKQRLREKRKTEGPGSTGLTHNSDIENVLDSSHDKPLPDIFIHKPRKRPSKPKRNKPHSHMNERFSDDENSEVPKAPETIQEARKRMHQLLDDAFSLLSSSTSSIGNKVNPAPPEEDKNYKPHTKPRSKKSNSTEKLTEEKSESPVYANPTFNGHDEGPVIETWSPYRAGDEVARISLPQTQAIKDKSPRQDKVNTTTFSEDLQTSLRDNYYTTEPAKPIVIKTKDLDRNGTKMNGISHLSSPMPNGGLSYPGIQNFDTLPSTRLNMYDNLNDDNIEMVTLTSNGHANQFEHRPYQAWRGDDEMDVIKKSIQPGVSPSPLIESIRDELKMLSRRNEANRHENIHIANGGDVSV